MAYISRPSLLWDHALPGSNPRNLIASESPKITGNPVDYEAGVRHADAYFNLGLQIRRPQALEWYFLCCGSSAAATRSRSRLARSRAGC